MSLPFDLQKLPPGAVDVLHDLGSMTDPEASAATIIQRTGLSERTFRKAIRRLVTRHYVAMTDRDVYALAPSGREAVDALRAVTGDAPAPAAPAEEDRAPEQAAPSAPEPAPVVPAPPEPVPAPALPSSAAAPITVPPPSGEPASGEPAPDDDAFHLRQLSIFIPCELVAHAASLLRAGFDAPGTDGVPLHGSGRLVLRLSAPGCTIDPAERPLDLPPKAAAGPVQFRVTPSESGPVRLSLAVFQFTYEHTLEPVGGLYVDLEASPFPTPASAEFQAVGAVVRLHPNV